jgi:hypothetical protein
LDAFSASALKTLLWGENRQDGRDARVKEETGAEDDARQRLGDLL